METALKLFIINKLCRKGLRMFENEWEKQHNFASALHSLPFETNKRKHKLQCPIPFFIHKLKAIIVRSLAIASMKYWLYPLNTEKLCSFILLSYTNIRNNHHSLAFHKFKLWSTSHQLNDKLNKMIVQFIVICF